MKISAVETMRIDEMPNLVFVQVRTDDGLVGLGETWFEGDAVEAYIHGSAAPTLLSADPRTIELHSRALRPYHVGGGAELRGNSAIDIALWDLLGQMSGQPLYQLLGGRTRDSIPAYNTCAGPNYSAKGKAATLSQWGLPGSNLTQYEDLEASYHRPAELATSLVEQGFFGMKVWPLDLLAEEVGGGTPGYGQLDAALEPLRKMREAVGSKIEILVELHSMWDLPAARVVMAAVEEFRPYWFEDPLHGTDAAGTALLSRESRFPIATGETLGGSRAFSDLIDHGFSGIIIQDISWVGGLTEARKVAAMAEAHNLPIASHDCTGPVVLTVSTHVGVSAPNALIQEMVRAYYFGWYSDLVTELPAYANGRLRPPEGPGLGIALQPDLATRAGVSVRHSSAKDA